MPQQPHSFVRGSFILLLATGLLAPVPTASGQAPAPDAEARDRVAASFLLGQGRMPTPAELDEWPATSSLADLMAAHRTRIRELAEVRRAVSLAAARDAFGTDAPPAAQTAAEGAADYAAMVSRHVEFLAASPDDYGRVIARAYRLVLARDVYSLEVDYWKKRPVLPFAMLAACVDDWARRNQPGLTVTAGIPSASVGSAYLAAVRLPTRVAAEARAAIGLGRPSPHDIAAHRLVVSPGAASVASVGGIHFAAAGNGDRLR